MKDKKFDVFFSQVNRTFITVDAKTKEEAIDKAIKQWRKDVVHDCCVDSVEELTHKD